MQHIDTTVLPDGVRRDLFIVDGRLSADPVDAPTIHAGGYAIPGLVDAHAHLALASPAGDEASDVERVRASARAQLDAGVLLVREPGSPTRQARDLGPDIGLPRVQTAGRFLTAPGRYFPGLAREVEPADLPAAVTEELAWSGYWAKVIGDFFDESGDMTPVFPLEILQESAAAAHALGGRITMHCMTRRGAELAIEAGFDAIEHGTSVDADLVDTMAAAGMAWVPTLSIAKPVQEILAADPGPASGWVPGAFVRQLDHVRLAAERGVHVLAGTDAGMVPHGTVAAEIRLLVAAGLSVERALGAGSWGARRYLGLPLIEVGAPADFVIYPDDPTQELAVLDHPALIVLDGRVVWQR